VVNPTAFPELNVVLGHLVAGARTTLGDNLVGVYLQGSFAIGDADEHSDVDFLVVIERELTEDEQRALQALHERLFELPTQWVQHLEGSYVPREHLRRIDPERRPWFYFDNGAMDPAWDSHDNSAVVRWSLREHGVVLAGPDPASLVDRIPAGALRAAVIHDLAAFGIWLRARDSWSARLQTLAVVTYCRILHTLETGIVSSKRGAGEWALDTLDPDWASLIRRALDERPDPWRKVHEVADPELVTRTLAFVDYAAESATRFGGTRPAAR
jgi:hypothetical protein